MIGKIGFNFAPFQKSLVNKNIASRNVSFGEVQSSHSNQDLDTRTPEEKEQNDIKATTSSRATLEAAEEDQQRYQELVGNCEV